MGLTQPITPQALHAAASTGSISNLVVWRDVSAGDVIFVPAGTIHAIGAGLVIAEIQQRSDATFRMFDYGRKRELHIDNAVAVAVAGPAAFHVPPVQLSGARTVLVSNRHFTIEKFDLPPDSNWRLGSDSETWMLVLAGSGTTADFSVTIGAAVYLESDRADIGTGTAGLTGLLAYTGRGLAPDLQRRVGLADTTDARRTPEAAFSASLTQAMAEPAHGCIETVQ